jgi:hypothetical protein
MMLKLKKKQSSSINSVRKGKKMTNLYRILLAMTICSLLYGQNAIGQEQGKKSDEICQRLFETYIARRGKINTSTVMAASHIVAERGRNTGFWKNVLQELQKNDERSEIGCVRVLGKMLGIDAAARDVIKREKKTRQMSAWEASVRLPPEVVKELVILGRKADRFRVDHYTIALARARVPDAKDFFQMILRDDTDKRYMSSTKFHAAVGLAQLGDSTGFAWLITNSDDPLPTVSNAWPPRVPNLNLNTCSVAALRQLSGETKLSTKQEWQAWWKTVDKKLLPKSHVTIVDP